MIQKLKTLFVSGGLKKISKIEKILIYLFLIAALFIVVFNIFNYDPVQGYDADAHFLYIDILPKISNLLPENTYEYFNPPLPYIIPSVIGTICEKLTTNDLNTCREIYKFAIQILQLIMFFCSIYFYFKIFDIFELEDTTLKLSFLALLLLLTANYKTFAMFRGETYIIFLNSILLYKFTILLKKSFKWVYADYIIFGTCIGLLALSRQWSFLLFPPYFLIYILIKKDIKTQYFKFIFYSFVLGFVISGWWYFRLFFEFGSFTAFNMSSSSLKFTNQPLNFYWPFNTSAIDMFVKPIRPNFNNQFFPVLYSSLWGDYWGSFSFTSNALSTGRNQLSIGDYLARVNIVSILPTFFLFAGLKVGYKALMTKNKMNIEIFNSLIFISILFSFFGYFLFAMKYPSYNGNTIKAVYIIQLFHLMSFLGAYYIKKLKENNIKRYKLSILFLIIAFIHNFSAMLSHY
ncbi:hypothetical protein N9S45_01145 [Candidatus Actinomarina sp.]|nr:hypothetical protein [Candidatus Actinomarina sp.]